MVLTHITREPVIAAEGPAPVLVLLHGVRSNERDLMGLAPKLDKRFFVLSLRAPITFEPGAYGWYHVEFLPGGDFRIDSAEAARNQQLLLDSLDETLGGYPVDRERLFLMGFSQGCAMSLGAALTQPRRFAGVVGLSGRLLPGKSVEPAELNGLPVLIQHGRQDPVIPLRYGHQIRDHLRKLQVRLEYREYDMGHHVSPESISDVAEWLTARLDDEQDWRTVSAA